LCSAQLAAFRQEIGSLKKAKNAVGTAFGLSWPSMSGPTIAAEGLERPSQTRAKRRKAGQGEAEPEAVMDSSGVPNIPALAVWLAKQLTETQLVQLLNELSSEEVNRG
jgi:hypothetical protein